MARVSFLTWRPVTIKDPYRRKIKPVRVNLHVAVSEASTLHGYFNDSVKNPDSHLYVLKNGGGEQYVDTARQAYADLEGSPDTLSAETQGGVKNANSEPWTDAQCETLARFIAWAHTEHGIPLRLATDSRPGPSSHGVSWHRLGIDGNFPGGLLKGRVQGGLKYSNARGKVCPGDAKIRQIPGILERAKQIAGAGGAALPTNPQEDEDMPLTEADVKAIAKAVPNIAEIRQGQSLHAGKVDAAVQRSLRRMIVPQLENLTTALARVAGGEAFDEAKLRAGVEASAAEGAREGVLAAQDELRDVLLDVLAAQPNLTAEQTAAAVVAEVGKRLGGAS